MKKVLVVFLLTIFVGNANAQNNAIKLTVGQQLFSSGLFALNYERKFTDEFSINLRWNFGSKKAVPYGNFYDGVTESILNDAGVSTNLFDSRFITTGGMMQFRFFPKKEALSGFYIAPYLGYQFGKLSDFSFEFPDINDSNIKHDGTVGAHLNYVGGGLGIGNQWIVKGFTFDILWVGLGWGQDWFVFHGASNSPKVDFQEIDSDVHAFFDETPGFNFFFRNYGTEVGDNSIDLKFRHGFPFVKVLNFSFGYSF